MIRKASVMMEEGKIDLRKKRVTEGKIAVTLVEKRRTITERKVIAIVGMMIIIIGMDQATEGKTIATEEMTHMLTEGVTIRVVQVGLKVTTEENLETDVLKTMPIGLGRTTAIVEVVEVVEVNGIDGKTHIADRVMEPSIVEMLASTMMRDGMILQGPSK